VTIAALLSELNRQDVQLASEGDKLRVGALPGVLTPDIKSAIATRKADLLAWLHLRELPQDVAIGETAHEHLGTQLKVYPARRACLDAGACLVDGQEQGCPLFVHLEPAPPPACWEWRGRCREKVRPVGPPAQSDAPAMPYLDEQGVLIIPLRAPAKYHWWVEGGQPVLATLRELGASEEVMDRYRPVGSAPVEEVPSA
jgi:hypothetical protein